MASDQRTLPQRVATLVEYPGIVHTPSAAIATLKGDVKGGSLSLNWQKTNPVAHPLQSEKGAFKGLLMRVSERGEVEMVAGVDTVHRFEELCDFGYTPGRLQTDDFAKAASGVSPQGRSFEKLVTEEPQFHPEPLLAVAPRFSKIRYPTDAIVKGKNVPLHLMKGTVRLSRQLVYFSTPDVPPAVLAAPEAALDDTDPLKCVEETLEKRPVWSKHMITQSLANQVTQQELLGYLKQHCYRFGDGACLDLIFWILKGSAGPWQKLWIRKGYDPRTDPESRHYQAISYTIPQTWYFRAAKSTKLSSLRDMMQRHTIAQMNRFEAWPIEKTTLLQLCDLEDASIQALLKDSTQISSTCGAATGWLVSEAWDGIQATVKERFNAALEQSLAAEEAAQSSEGVSTEGESVFASFLTGLPSEPLPSDDNSSSGEDESTQLDME